MAGDYSELIRQWQEIQQQMRQRLIVRPLSAMPRFVAGADAAFTADKRTVLAAAVIYDLKLGQIIEKATTSMALTVPYIPGYLSFREGPAVLEALGRLRHGWDLLMCDGQGYAHPRRCGLACHVAITLDRPGIGVAKSRLIGEFAAPAAQAGQSAPLLDQGQQIGLVLRTRCGVRPLFISVAHRINLGWAARVVLACCAGCRVPEPTRQADIEVAKLKRGSGQ